MDENQIVTKNLNLKQKTVNIFVFNLISATFDSTIVTY